jgi:hypothetical protein
MQHARNDQTCVTVLIQVTNKLHSCCMWQPNITILCARDLPVIILLSSVKSADVMRLFFPIFQWFWHVCTVQCTFQKLSNNTIPKTCHLQLEGTTWWVIKYIWKPSLQPHNVCSFSMLYSFVIMLHKVCQINWNWLKNIVSHNIITNIVSLVSFLLKTTSRTNHLIKLLNSNYWCSLMNDELLLSLLNNQSH